MNTALSVIEADTGFDKLTARRNSVGSEYLAFQADKDTVLKLADIPLEKYYPRVILDYAQGQVMLMTPSLKHEQLSQYIDSLVTATAVELSIKSSGLLTYRWRRANDPQHTGMEADRSYYLGSKAVAYLDALSQSVQQASEFVLEYPPDLVVEVGISFIDKSKQARYREFGVTEYWAVNQDARAGEAVAVTFLALQRQEPRVITTSTVLPGLSSKDSETALLAFRKQKLSTPYEYQRVVKEILRKKAAITGMGDSEAVG